MADDQTQTPDLAAQLAEANARNAALEQQLADLERPPSSSTPSSSTPSSSSSSSSSTPSSPAINDVVMFRGAAAHVVGVDGDELELLVGGNDTVRAARDEWSLPT